MVSQGILQKPVSKVNRPDHQKLKGSPNRKNKAFISWVAFGDALAVTASYFCAYFLRFTSGIIPTTGHVPSLSVYAQTLLVILPAYMILFRAHGLYDPQRRMKRVEEIFQVIKVVTYALVLLLAMSFFYRGLSYSRAHLVVFWFFSMFFVSSSRYLLIENEYRRKVQNKEIDRVLLIGANRQARQIIQWSQSNPHYGQEVIGVLSKEEEMIGKHLDGVPVLGKIEDTHKFIFDFSPHRVILADTSFPRDKITELVISCEDQWIEFKVVADVYGLLTRHVDVEYLSSVPLLGFRSIPLDDVWHRFTKRVFDILVASAMLVIGSPVWLSVIALIKFSGKGPIFYAQERVGRDQRAFKVLKFRTMRVNAEDETGPVWAQKNDTRRTKIGNFLRHTNLDELPQLLNVLRGEMSLVGPRPERPYFVEQFRESIPRYMGRHKIKSGLTGWAQVNGFRGNTSIHERLKFDLYYMENWSLFFDIEILFMTFSSKAFRNAY